jgi:hypothetical protein
MDEAACKLLYTFVTWRKLASYSCMEGRLHTRDREPVTHYSSSTLIDGKAKPVQVCFALRLRDQHSMWLQDGCKVYMDAYMASNGSYFMVTWTIFKNHLLEVGLKQHRETMVRRTLTTVGLFYFIMCEDPHEKKFVEIGFGWGLGHIWFHITLEDMWPYCMILEVCWDGLWTLSFGPSQFHGHGSWFPCQVALTCIGVF